MNEDDAENGRKQIKTFFWCLFALLSFVFGHDIVSPYPLLFTCFHSEVHSGVTTP